MTIFSGAARALPVSDSPSRDDLPKLNKDQLTALCEEMGIDVPKRANKETLLALLREKV